MKRIALVLLACVFMAGSAWGETAIDEYCYTVTNTTGIYQVSTVPTTIIRPTTDKITRITIQGRTFNSENMLAVYDSTSIATMSELIGEVEAAEYMTNGLKWERGRKILNGLVVRQGGNTVVNIYFIKA